MVCKIHLLKQYSLTEWMMRSISRSCVCCCCTVKYKSVIVLDMWFNSATRFSSFAVSFLLCLKSNQELGKTRVPQYIISLYTTQEKFYITYCILLWVIQHQWKIWQIHQAGWLPARWPFLDWALGCSQVFPDWGSTFWLSPHTSYKLFK